MSDPKNKPTQEGRRRWLKGETTANDGDELTRRARRGREMLDNDTAAELLAELDAELDEAYGTGAVESEAPPRRMKLYVPKKRWFALAATILLLLLAGWWLMGDRALDGPGLYATHFEHFENELVIRKMGEGGVDDPALAAAFVGYERQEYARAVEELTAYVENHPDADPRANFYLGISQLAVGNIPVAREYLELSLRKNYQVDAARWYLALAGLKDNNPDLASRQLTQLAAGNSLFKTKAAQLLREINER